MRTAFLGVALIVDVAAMCVALVAGVDVGPLDELAYVLVGAVGGAALAKPGR